MKIYNWIFALLAPVLVVSCINDDLPMKNDPYEVSITYNDNGTVTVDKPEGTNVNISVDGHKVTVDAFDQDITYRLSGYSDDGYFKINSSVDGMTIILDQLMMFSSSGGVINSQSNKKIRIEVPAGTLSYLCDGGLRDETGTDKGTIFAEGGLTFSGGGTLVVEGLRQHAICSDDYIIFNMQKNNEANGNLMIQSAVSDGLRANDYVALLSGAVKITAMSDGIECDRGNINVGLPSNISNEYLDVDITAGGRGIATTSDSVGLNRNISIYAGTINIRSVQSVEKDSTGYAIRSTGDMLISGGDITLLTKKKAISAGKSVPLNEAPAGYNPANIDDNDTPADPSDDEVYMPQKLFITGGMIRGIGTVRPQLNSSQKEQAQVFLYYEQAENDPKNTTYTFWDDVNIGDDPIVSITNPDDKGKRVFYSTPELKKDGIYTINKGLFSPLYTFNVAEAEGKSYFSYSGIR